MHANVSDNAGLAEARWLRCDGAAAAVVPPVGFCCAAFRVRLDKPGAAFENAWLRVLDEPPSGDALRQRPAFFGTPLLFPFPMAIPGGAFTYRGEQYALRPTREGRVVHGLVRDHPWTIERAWSDSHGAHIRASICTAGNDDLLSYFPFPFRLAATYTLDRRALTLETEATNLGDRPMPAGLGIHPYFPIPLLPAAQEGRPEACVTASDVTHLVAVGHDGRTLEMSPVPDHLDLRAGQVVTALLAGQPERRPRGGLLVSYARLPPPGAGPARDAPPTTSQAADRLRPAARAGDWAGVRWSLIDRDHGLTVEVETDEQFWVLVLFAPPGPPAVISPVLCTCLPNAFNLASHGHATGMVELEPRQTWRARARIRVLEGPPSSAGRGCD
jgi:galactose mutarotase-like enzyme